VLRASKVCVWSLSGLFSEYPCAKVPTLPGMDSDSDEVTAPQPRTKLSASTTTAGLARGSDSPRLGSPREEQKAKTSPREQLQQKQKATTSSRDQPQPKKPEPAKSQSEQQKKHWEEDDDEDGLPKAALVEADDWDDAFGITKEPAPVTVPAAKADNAKPRTATAGKGTEPPVKAIPAAVEAPLKARTATAGKGAEPAKATPAPVEAPLKARTATAGKGAEPPAKAIPAAVEAPLKARTTTAGKGAEPLAKAIPAVDAPLKARTATAGKGAAPAVKVAGSKPPVVAAPLKPKAKKTKRVRRAKQEPPWLVGDRVMAQFDADDLWYKAKILSKRGKTHHHFRKSNPHISKEK
jgi:hypothetical protein